jgi:hypothetical protein
MATFDADLQFKIYRSISKFGCSKNTLAGKYVLSGRLHLRTAPPRIRSRVIKLDRSMQPRTGLVPVFSRERPSESLFVDN